jgi:hypothetical protein
MGNHYKKNSMRTKNTMQSRTVDISTATNNPFLLSYRILKKSKQPHSFSRTICRIYNRTTYHCIIENKDSSETRNYVENVNKHKMQMFWTKMADASALLYRALVYTADLVAVGLYKATRLGNRSLSSTLIASPLRSWFSGVLAVMVRRCPSRLSCRLPAADNVPRPFFY